MTEFKFRSWEFVRVMVRLESVPARRSKKSGPSFYQANRDVWEKLDRRLGRLAESDAQAFSDLMMKQNVTAAFGTPDQVREVSVALDDVVGEMNQVIDKGGEDAELLVNLENEIKELKALKRRLNATLS
jgi:DNA repair ATPase RecN